MFFQLSLPSTPPAADTVGDSVLPELGTAGTLTIEPNERPTRDQVARLTSSRVRDAKHVLRLRISGSGEAAMTFTAPPAPTEPEEGIPRLQ
jgi:hypothetical protein